MFQALCGIHVLPFSLAFISYVGNLFLAILDPLLQIAFYLCNVYNLYCPVLNSINNFLHNIPSH